MRQPALAKTLYLIGVLFLLVSAGLTSSHQWARAASYDLVWQPQRYVGVRLVGFDENISPELCVGVSEWKVTGSVNGQTINEIWDGHGYDNTSQSDTRLVTNGTYQKTLNISPTDPNWGNLSVWFLPTDPGGYENGVWFFNVGFPEFKRMYRAQYGLNIYYTFTGRAKTCEMVNPINGVSGFVRSNGNAMGFDAWGRRMGNYAFEAVADSSPDKPWDYAQINVSPKSWVISGTISD